MSNFSVCSFYLNKAKQGMVLTKFLDETELNELLTLINNKYKYIIEGGYDNSERNRVIISPHEDFDFNDFEIGIIKVEYPNKYVKINHRNVLGTIMSLGINRNTIGDIIITSDEKSAIYVIVIKDMITYLKNNLIMINGYPVKLKEVSYKELQNIKLKEAIEKSYIIASMRIDVILASVIGVSRNEVNKYFDEKKVLVNHQICINKHYECKIDDLISVRKFGRIAIKEDIKKTKKNNLVIKVKIWR